MAEDVLFQSSKLPVQILDGFAVRSIGQFWGNVVSEIDPPPINLCGGKPFSDPTVITDTFISGSIVAVLGGVLLILCAGSNPKIFSLIVEGFPVAVVALTLVSKLQSKDFSMYGDILLSVVAKIFNSPSIKTLSELRPVCKPLPLTEPIEITGGHQSKLPLGKFDETVRCCRAGFLCKQVHVSASPKALATRL